MELNDWLAITGALRDWKLSAGIHILCKPQNARKENLPWHRPAGRAWHDLSGTGDLSQLQRPQRSGEGI